MRLMFESFINDKYCSLFSYLFFCAKIYIKKEETLSSFDFILSYSFPLVYKLFDISDVFLFLL
jgi:hypothetical protein